MDRLRGAALAIGMGLMATTATASPPDPPAKVVLVIHGGAGALPRAELTPELERDYRAALEEALRAGHAALREGRTSLDAVESAIRVMEDSPLFNAGKGAVLNHEGHAELDASIMDGATRRAGAVAGLTTVKNPIAAARAVMEKSPHVMLIGAGADRFAKEVGIEIVAPSYFETPRRRKELEKALEREKAGREKQARAGATGRPDLGTVGAVALDRRGHLAAGTSTGGMTNKRFGRVGDSPLIGAGCYADDRSCAVSATGHGEYFIRYVVAHDIAALVAYKGLSVDQAAAAVVHGTLKTAGGEGGVIALDARGNFAAPFNSEGMYRGWITEDGETHVAIYRD